MNLLYIAVGGALGAVLRYLAGNAAVRYFNPQLPYGTFIINITGCFLMGLLMTLIVDKGLLPPVWRLFCALVFWAGLQLFRPSVMKFIRFWRRAIWLTVFYMRL